LVDVVIIVIPVPVFNVLRVLPVVVAAEVVLFVFVVPSPVVLAFDDLQNQCLHQPVHSNYPCFFYLYLSPALDVDADPFLQHGLVQLEVKRSS
jgi:hypothetical protein